MIINEIEKNKLFNRKTKKWDKHFNKINELQLNLSFVSNNVTDSMFSGENYISKHTSIVSKSRLSIYLYSDDFLDMIKNVKDFFYYLST